MASIAVSEAGPLSPNLGPAPAGDWWNDMQWTALWALLDAVLAPVVAEDDDDDKNKNKNTKNDIPGPAGFDDTSVKHLPRKDYEDVLTRIRAAVVDPPDAALVAAFLADRPSGHPAFLDAVKRTVAGLAPDAKASLGTVLTALSGRPGALALTGYATPIQHQPIRVRETILLAWQNAWTPALRKLSRALCSLAQLSWLVSSDIFRRAAGYRDVPRPWRPAGQDTSPEFPDYRFLQFAPEKEPAVVETDVVIVGSGCGGAVCAQVLAAAGHRVVVVDKGYHYAPAQLPMSQETGARLLYENGGAVASTDTDISVLAGACWGGGGTINWSVCLRPTPQVRREWSTAKGQPGMAFVDSPAFDASLDRVEAFMCDDCKDADGQSHRRARPSLDGQSHRGRVVLDGAAKLRFAAAPLLQNTHDGRPHDDGYCHLGCASAAKRGPTVSWLPAAAAAGAQFIEGFHVDRVLFDGDDGHSDAAPAPVFAVEEPLATQPRATGVVGTWQSRDPAGSTTAPDDQRHKRRLIIQAKRVIVSGGSLRSPLVLLKSGLINPQIGRNLHIHPCVCVYAFFDEETKPMDHGIITSICTSFSNLDSHGHGASLEPICMVPYVILTNLPWQGALDFKLAALRYRHGDGFITLIRDRDSGRVFPDPTTGQPVVDYTPSARDRESGVEGAIGMARLCHAAGANEIWTYLPGVEPWKKGDPFEPWIVRVRAAGFSASPLWGGWQAATPYGSAHQMGTCRMGDDGGATSVVDPRGRVWGTRGLHVADASVFPSASGVNPMITAMALADWIAQSIVQDLASERAAADKAVAAAATDKEGVAVE